MDRCLLGVGVNRGGGGHAAASERQPYQHRGSNGDGTIPRPADAATREGGAAQKVFLRNEANFSKSLRLWNALIDREVQSELRHVVTWLRFAGDGFV